MRTIKLREASMYYYLENKWFIDDKKKFNENNDLKKTI